jgi:hypothetical protein
MHADEKGNFYVNIFNSSSSSNSLIIGTGSSNYNSHCNKILIL